MLLGLLFVAAACRDAPTGAALLDMTDSLQRELATGMNKDKSRRFMSALWRWYGRPLAHADIPVRVGREERWYTGFAYEDMRVRMDPNDGYPCPLVRRTLVAWVKKPKPTEGPWEFVTVSGADFDLPISRTGPFCRASLARNPSRPVVNYLGPNSDYNQEGVQGRATIVPVPGKSGSCPFNPEGNDPIKVQCELTDFEVQLEAEVAPVPEDSVPNSDVRTRLEISAIHVPGIRLRTYCDSTTYSYREGCTWQEHEDSLLWARNCRFDSLQYDSLRRSLMARGLDPNDYRQWTPCRYDVWYKERHGGDAWNKVEAERREREAAQQPRKPS
jgi:hypothetical protein